MIAQESNVTWKKEISLVNNVVVTRTEYKVQDEGSVSIGGPPPPS